MTLGFFIERSMLTEQEKMKLIANLIGNSIYSTLISQELFPLYAKTTPTFEGHLLTAAKFLVTYICPVKEWAMNLTINAFCQSVKKKLDVFLQTLKESFDYPAKEDDIKECEDLISKLHEFCQSVY